MFKPYSPNGQLAQKLHEALKGKYVKVTSPDEYKLKVPKLKNNKKSSKGQKPAKELKPQLDRIKRITFVIRPTLRQKILLAEFFETMSTWFFRCHHNQKWTQQDISDNSNLFSSESKFELLSNIKNLIDKNPNSRGNHIPLANFRIKYKNGFYNLCGPFYNGQPMRIFLSRRDEFEPSEIIFKKIYLNRDTNFKDRYTVTATITTRYLENKRLNSGSQIHPLPLQSRYFYIVKRDKKYTHL
jgi:hypothetical protein